MQVEERDYDGDGRLDFVALISQEHESLVLFRNDGNGRFESEVLDRAPHPACGTSGFQLVDLDRDGDLDILATNGDMMDEISLAKPYHGVRWLENIDGHLDIVVSSLNFTASKIIYSPTNLATMDVGDINHDGIPDVIVGGLHVPGPLGRHARVTAVFNTGKLRAEEEGKE
jgi:hypothetical protein